MQTTIPNLNDRRRRRFVWLVCASASAFLCGTLCGWIFCSGRRKREELSFLLSKYGVTSPVRSARFEDSLLFAGKGMVVWMRAAEGEGAMYVKGRSAGGIHVFSADGFVGAIPVDAWSRVYAPSIVELPEGILILSYQFGISCSESVEESEYLAQLHLATSEACELILEFPFRQCAYEGEGRFVSRSFSLVSDTLGRLLLVEMSYNDPDHEEEPKITWVKGRSVYVWSSEAHAFEALEPGNSDANRSLSGKHGSAR